MKTYILATTILHWLLFGIWTKKDKINILIKLAFLSLAIVGVIMYLSIIGWIVVSG